MIVEGQVHGGLVQGIGQALLEHAVYDEDSGQLLTGSFMDYAMPRADDVPDFEVKTNEVLCTTNALGVKGCGEAGTIGGAACVMNAVCDALDIGHMDMPASPERGVAGDPRQPLWYGCGIRGQHHVHLFLSETVLCRRCRRRPDRG